MIIYFGPGGRLGNLLFQLAYLQKVRRPGEKVWTTGMSGLRRFLVPPIWLRDFSGPFALGIEKKVLKPLFVQILTRFGIISSRFENNGSWTEKHGLFRGILYVHGYFQAEAVPQNSAESWLIRQSWKAQAARLAAQYPGPRYFVHIRLTDYRSVEVYGKKDASLPLEYFRRAWDRVLPRIGEPWLFVFSDDPFSVRNLFSRYPKAVFWSNSAEVDLLLMGSCNGGILSNSSYSWWGAFFTDKTLPLVAPRYWMGYKSRKLAPAGFQIPFAEEMDVPYEEA
jgi:hypothetical protein